MAPRFTRLSLSVQTTYARVLDMLLTTEAGDLTAGATLVVKRIRGRRYWYVQRTLDGKKVQSYLGPETPDLEARIEIWRRAKAEETSRAELVAMARAGGAYLVTATEARVLERLAAAFRMGAVLVGSHAFAVLGNSLGVRWQDASVRTDDIDLAHDPQITVAAMADLPPLNLDDVLLPRFDVLDPTSPATSFQVRGTEIQVDLLTPMTGRARSTPIRIPALGAAATPLRFLDYLIEDTQPAAVLGGAGVLVNVPRPGRYAFHKLIVAGRRGSGVAKAAKDRAQASALLELLFEDLPGELTIAWTALQARGTSWVRAVRETVALLDTDLVAKLAGIGITRR